MIGLSLNGMKDDFLRAIWVLRERDDSARDNTDSMIRLQSQET